MKKEIIILIIFVIFIGGFVFYKKYKTINQEPAYISSLRFCDHKEILIKIQEIESKIHNYDPRVKDLIGKSTEGGEQTDYISEGKRVLIKQVFYGETGKSEITYYLYKDKIFYIKKINSEYIFPLFEDPSGGIKNTDVKEFLLNEKQELCSWYQNKIIQKNDKDTKEMLDYLISNI